MANLNNLQGLLMSYRLDIDGRVTLLGAFDRISANEFASVGVVFP